MNLDKLQIKASIRNGSQAIDLGYLLARQWWFHLILASFLPSLILFIPLLFIFSHSPILAFLIIWWLKPVWERLPLFYASRKIFNETISLGDISANLKLIFFNQFLANVLLRRLSLQRAFDAPVSLLENLSSISRIKRLAVLHGKYNESAVNNQFVIFVFEIVASVALFFLVVWLIPDNLNFEIIDANDNFNLVSQWICSLSAFIVMTLAMPFHCMAGFSLYINRRIELEAWDIEITFRKIANKRTKLLSSNLALIGLICICFLAIKPSDSLAQINHTQDSSKDLIQQVLKGDDFGTQRKIEKWRFKSISEEEKPSLFPDWMIKLLKLIEEFINVNEKKKNGTDVPFLTWVDYMKVILIVASVSVFIYLFYRYREPILQWHKKSPPSTKIDPVIMFGLDVTAKSLPDNVITEVLQLWQEHNQRAAMSLLYRATLSRLIEYNQFEFKASDTELECAQKVKVSGEQLLSEYFYQLTRTWQHLAYGHQFPSYGEFQQLCQQWDMQIKMEKKLED